MKSLSFLVAFILLPTIAMGQLKYDAQPPEIHMPVLERERSANYDLSNINTYAIYGDPHYVNAPQYDYAKNNFMAIWCTKEATFVVNINVINEEFAYMVPRLSGYIMDCATGIKYPIVKELGYPTDKGLYLVRALPCSHIISCEVYPPLPPTCTHITYGQDAVEKPDQLRIKPQVLLENLEISQLQANQTIMKYSKPKIVY